MRWLKMQGCLGDLKRQQALGVETTFFHPVLKRPRKEVLLRFMTSGAIHGLFLRWSRPTADHPDGLLVGDISPSYCQFYVNNLPKLLQDLEKDFEVRAFVIWRDPLDRLDSAMKHVTRDNQQKGIRMLEAFCRTGHMDSWSFHGRYAHAAEVLDEHFGDAFELVYEELFGPNGQTHLDAFHDWLGIRRMPGDFSARIHGAGPGSVSLTPEQRASARKFLQPQYDVMEARLGKERLASIWNI